MVGGGFAGTLFALLAAHGGVAVTLVERGALAGPGLAYGACAPWHMLNVPVARMESGLAEAGAGPRFADWLRTCGADLAEALAEADGDLSAAFVPRALFGAYLAQCLEAALADPARPLTRLRGEVVEVIDRPAPAVRLADGRLVAGTHVVLATGNLPPRLPGTPQPWHDSPHVVPDPWDARQRARLPQDAPVVFIGSGLTMVDMALSLDEAGHAGPMVAVSRHGLLPLTHRAGGTAAPVLSAEATPTVTAALAVLRRRAADAAADGVPWQRVMDAARPALPSVWNGWTEAEKARFLRHGRTLWDIHRHRMAPRIAARLERLIARGQLRVIAGRIVDGTRSGEGLAVRVHRRGGGAIVLQAAQVVNTTGPRSDFDRLAFPPFARLREQGRLVPDALGLGVLTRDCALVDQYGEVSDWLYALGPLTRPAFWEITAVPEIAAQARHLAGRLAAGTPGATAPLLAGFRDLGAGI